MLSVILTLDEVVELLEVEEPVLVARFILLLDDEVVGVDLVLAQALSLVLTHELGKRAVELLDILGEKFSISKHLLEQFLLILFADEATLNPQALISNNLPTVVEDLFLPVTSLLLLLESLNLCIPLLEGELSNFPKIGGVLYPERGEQVYLLNSSNRVTLSLHS